MIRAIITDIEGTTSSLAFVKEVLFPYAAAALPAYLAAQRANPEVAALLDAVRGGDALDEAGVIARLQQWIAEDRKATPLKTLQGFIWAEGYRSGTLQGHVHADAVRALRRWHADGIALYVYSSGSVAAQKLLFGYTAFGDLTPLFSGYFDTHIGPKRAPESYQAILRHLEQPAANVLFLSDIREELDAAARVGLRTVQVARVGEGEPDPAGAHPQVRDFDAILLN